MLSDTWPSARVESFLQGLTKGENIPNLGHVKISWFTGQHGSPVPPAKSAPAPASVPTAEDETTSQRAPTPDVNISESHVAEEEAAASGWGGEEGDGMGLF